MSPNQVIVEKIVQTKTIGATDAFISAALGSAGAVGGAAGAAARAAMAGAAWAAVRDAGA